MKHSILVRAILGILILIVGVWLFEGRRIYAKVGDFKIYKKDIERRNDLIRMNYPNEKGDFGYKQLEDSYISYQIMRNHGYKKIEERLKSEEERVEQNSKNPEVLAQIKKKIFDNDNSSFRRAYIFPAAIDEEVFFGFYLGSLGLHQETLQLAQQLIEDVKKSGKKLEEVGQENGFLHGVIEVNRDKGVRLVDKVTLKPIGDDPVMTTAGEGRPRNPGPQRRSRQENPEAAFWMNTILKDVKDGEVIFQPIGEEEQWYVGRLIRKNAKTAYVERLTIPKKSFSQMIDEEKKKVPIRKGFFLF